jgi:archaellum component FlaC
MPRVQKRKYEKIDNAEIDLVVQCKDSHEFYKRYREIFPDKKKGIDSISKIWKRRGEFVKKLQPFLEILVMAQNKVLTDLSALIKEHLQVTRMILERLPERVQKTEEHLHKPAPPKAPEQKETAKKPGHDKPADIVIGS